MKKILFFLMCSLLLSAFSLAQDSVATSILFKRGDSLYNAKNYLQSAIIYSKGIRQVGGKAIFQQYWYAAEA